MKNNAENREPSRVFLEAFRADAASMRKWLVAYGVGASAFLLSQQHFADYLSHGNNATVIILFLAGAGIQVAATFVYKYLTWPLHLGELNHIVCQTRRYKLCHYLYNALWFELCFDASTLILFSVATVWVFVGVASQLARIGAR